jgi:hypothetical protein
MGLVLISSDVHEARHLEDTAPSGDSKQAGIVAPVSEDLKACCKSSQFFVPWAVM